jgi:hypothetical protein
MQLLCHAQLPAQLDDQLARHAALLLHFRGCCMGCVLLPQLLLPGDAAAAECLVRLSTSSTMKNINASRA